MTVSEITIAAGLWVAAVFGTAAALSAAPPDVAGQPWHMPSDLLIVDPTVDFCAIWIGASCAFRWDAKARSFVSAYPIKTPFHPGGM